MVSLPLPAQILSLPPRPKILSFPARETITSALGVPRRVLLFAFPTIVAREPRQVGADVPLLDTPGAHMTPTATSATMTARTPMRKRPTRHTVAARTANGNCPTPSPIGEFNPGVSAQLLPGRGLVVARAAGVGAAGFVRSLGVQELLRVLVVRRARADPDVDDRHRLDDVGDAELGVAPVAAGGARVRAVEVLEAGLRQDQAL